MLDSFCFCFVTSAKSIAAYFPIAVLSFAITTTEKYVLILRERCYLQAADFTESL